MLRSSTKYNAPSALATQVPAARSQNALQHLRIEGLKVKYVGPGSDDSEAATVRTNYPVPPDCPLYYFEVEILNKGELGFIGVGFVTDEVLLSRLPGWDIHSYGYHGDDGYAFSGSGNGKAYGPTYTTGDTIGALLSRVDNTIRYFKNGTDLGIAFRNVHEDRLFPCVGLRSQREEVLMNLGRSQDPPFVSDLTSVMQSAKHTVQAAVQAAQLPAAALDGTPLMVRLVHDYLLHHRYWKAAGLMAKSVLPDQPHTHNTAPSNTQQQPTHTQTHTLPLPLLASPSGIKPHTITLDTQQDSQQGVAPMDHEPAATAVGTTEAVSRNGQVLASSSIAEERSAPAGPRPASEEERFLHMHVRQRVFSLICEGHMETARSVLDQHLGTAFLTQRTRLDFRLKVSHFCEVLRTGQVETAMHYAREVLAQHSHKYAEDEELLCDALSLLAYEQPAASPCGYLLTQSQRSQLAEEVDRSVLEAAGLPGRSALERLMAQTVVTLDTLRDMSYPQAALIDVSSSSLAG